MTVHWARRGAARSASLREVRRAGRVEFGSLALCRLSREGESGATLVFGESERSPSDRRLIEHLGGEWFSNKITIVESHCFIPKVHGLRSAPSMPPVGIGHE